jgi:hypothetical protein
MDNIEARILRIVLALAIFSLGFVGVIAYGLGRVFHG